uniref:Uncharacterized protein n=1 Tax=Octopus bimaculoides TaxID=37653 RepID=A0A0L8G2R1_OCTBM
MGFYGNQKLSSQICWIALSQATKLRGSCARQSSILLVIREIEVLLLSSLEQEVVVGLCRKVFGRSDLDKPYQGEKETHDDKRAVCLHISNFS